jgi:hypothetical protein
VLTRITCLAALLLLACTSVDRSRDEDDDSPSITRRDAGRISDGGASDGGDDPGDAGADNDAGVTHDGGTGSMDAGAADAGSGPAITFCQMGCTAASDCASGTAGGFTDADNYACQKGLCVFNGCKSDAECQVTYGTTQWTCRAMSGSVSSCYQTCQSVNDCIASTETAGAFDRDNYECRSGACVFTGCKSDAECATSLNSTKYRCHEAFPGGYPYCYLADCSIAADCAVGQTAGGAYDPDNWKCSSGACEWQGCRNDSECATTFQGTGKNYICR